jgi:hypothetical protein
MQNKFRSGALGDVWPQYSSNSLVTICLEPPRERNSGTASHRPYSAPRHFLYAIHEHCCSACHGLLPYDMNDESPSLNSREECGPAGGANKPAPLRSDETRGFFLPFLQRPSLFKSIVILLETIHLFVISTQCYRILVLVASILAQLWMTLGVTCKGMWTHTFLPSSIPLEWGKPLTTAVKSATELTVSLSSTWVLNMFF